MGSRPIARDQFVVTVTIEQYVTVKARDEDHAREVVERQINAGHFGGHRSSTITEIEQDT